MTLYYPEGTPTLGNTKVSAILTVASLTAPKLATEIKAATSVDGSLYLYPAGWAPSATTAKGEKPPRLGSKKTLQQFNRTGYDLADLQYVYDPQAALSAPGNELMEILEPGLQLVLLERIGLDAEDVDWLVGQHTRAHYVELNDQIPSGDRTDQNGEFFITQSVIYVNDGPVDGIIVT